MRKIFYVSLLIFILAFLTSSYAGVRNFGRIDIEVPKGWTVARDRGGSTIILRALNNNAVVRLNLGKLENEKLWKIAADICEAHGGENFRVDSEGKYTFHYRNIEDVKCSAVVSANEGYYMFLSASGEGDDLDEVISSIKWNSDAQK